MSLFYARAGGYLKYVYIGSEILPWKNIKCEFIYTPIDAACVFSSAFYSHNQKEEKSSNEA